MSLEQEDLGVEEAESGQAGIDFTATTLPDIVILDLQMPSMDGFAVCQRMRQLPRGDFVQILIMTGSNDVDSIAQAYQMGATDFIVKPFRGLILSQRVRYMLRASHNLSALRSSESRLAKAQRIAQLGGWEWDLVRNHLDLPETASRILGIDPGSFDHTLVAYQARVHEGDRDVVAEAMREAVTDGTGLDLDHRMMQTDGKERIVHLLGEIVTDEGTNTRCMMGTVQESRISGTRRLRFTFWPIMTVKLTSRIEACFSIASRRLSPVVQATALPGPYWS